MSTQQPQDKCACGRMKPARYPTCYQCKEGTSTAVATAEPVQVAIPTKPFQYLSEEGKQISFTIELIRAMFPDVKPTPIEAYSFAEYCSSRKLDPRSGLVSLVRFQKDAYAQPWLEVPAFERRANRDPNFRFYKSGIKVKRGNGTIECVQGRGYYPEEGDKLLGGWSEIYLHDGQTIYDETPLHEAIKMVAERDDSGKPTGKLRAQGLWATQPGLMVEKASIRTNLRHHYSDVDSGHEEYNAFLEKLVAQNRALYQGAQEAKPALGTAQDLWPTDPQDEAPATTLHSLPEPEREQDPEAEAVEGTFKEVAFEDLSEQPATDPAENHVDTEADSKEPANAQPDDGSAEPAPVTEYADLEIAVAKAGLEWDAFEISVLGKSWAAYERDGGTPQSAWELLRKRLEESP